MSLSKVNKRMFNKTAVLWFEFLSIISGVTSFAFKVYVCHERNSRDKGKKRNTKKLWKITAFNFTPSLSVINWRRVLVFMGFTLFNDKNSSPSSLEEEFQKQVSVSKSPDLFSL